MTQIRKCINAIYHSNRAKKKNLAGVREPIHTRYFYSPSTGVKEKSIGQRQCLMRVTI